ncbi:MAG: ABC transporter permease [Anaerolineae bacterium]
MIRATSVPVDVKHTWLVIRRRVIRNWELYVMIAPVIILIFVFSYIPMVGAQIAFRDYNPRQGIWGSPWVGLDNFKWFFSIPTCWRLIRNTLMLSGLGIVIGFPAPIILAVMINEIPSERFRKFVQTITYAPNFISTVVMVSIILTLLNPRIGVAGLVFRWLGLPPVDLMAKPNAFPWIYVLSNIWQYAGFDAIVYLAALSGISPELYEAARMDGASRLQRIWHIDIPGITPVIVVLLILSISSILSVGFEKIYLMQNALNQPISEVISTYVYKMGLLTGDYSFGTAVGLFNSVVNFALLIGANWIAKRTQETSLW